MPDYNKESLELHRQLSGKIEIINKTKVLSTDDLSKVYSPGVAGPSLEIERYPETVYDLTIKGNTVAVVSDGSAVLGLGNIGALASLPVMEGKCMLFKRFAGINAFPICLNTQDSDEIVKTIKNIAPVFGGINLEDIAAPRCFYIEKQLQDIGIPVFHDDQHGTAIVVLAGLINASKLLNKDIADMKVVINGAGAAGVAITKLLRCIDLEDSECVSVKQILVCDSKGIISQERKDLSSEKKELLQYTNLRNISGRLEDALENADVFIGVSKGNLLTQNHIRSMAKNPVIFALANPTPEIFPEEALASGAAIVATGRSDYPNQVNNVLAFPGIFRAALDVRAKKITPSMKIAAAYALARTLKNPDFNHIITSSLDKETALQVAHAVREAYNKSNVVTHH
ncbi:MAG: NAD(P)-dependent malic enzyme [Bacteroidota bacterium]